MEQNRENPETEPSMYGHILINGAGSVGCPHGGKNATSVLPQQNHLLLDCRLKCKSQTIKLQEDNVGEYLHNLGTEKHLK